MPVVTISDYNHTQWATARHPFARQCPNMRTCWPGLSASYNPFIPSRTLMLRRTAFLLIQILQLAHLVRFMTFPPTLSSLPWLLSGILFFFFVAWNLHLIVKMEGDRIVFGKRFGRAYFDGLLWAFVVCYAALLFGQLWLGNSLGIKGGYVGSLSYLSLDLAIFGVAWVSTWSPQGLVVIWEDEMA